MPSPRPILIVQAVTASYPVSLRPRHWLRHPEFHVRTSSPRHTCVCAWHRLYTVDTGAAREPVRANRGATRVRRGEGWRAGPVLLLRVQTRRTRPACDRHRRGGQDVHAGGAQWQDWRGSRHPRCRVPRDAAILTKACGARAGIRSEGVHLQLRGRHAALTRGGKGRRRQIQVDGPNDPRQESHDRQRVAGRVGR